MARLLCGALLTLVLLAPACGRAQAVVPSAEGREGRASAPPPPESGAEPLSEEQPAAEEEPTASDASPTGDELAEEALSEASLDAEPPTGELEELRQAEEAAVEPARPASREPLFHHLSGGGPAGLLRSRLLDALDGDRPLPFLPRPAPRILGGQGFDLVSAKRAYDIPVEMEPLVLEYIQFFQTVGRKHFVKWLGRAGRYRDLMRSALREAGLPEDLVFLAMIESGFSPLAYSRARAAGPWQFIEPTGRRFGLQVDFWVDQRRDPVRSTRAAAAFLRELYAEFGDWRLAWAGYNAGPGKVRRAIQEEGTTSFWELAQDTTFHKETKHYVPKLMAAALIAKHLEAFGFSPEEIEEQAPLEWDEAEVPEATDLEVIAQAAGVPLQHIQELNPELRRWCTPPSDGHGSGYTIRLPKGTRERFAQSFARIAPKDRLTFRVHRVVAGDTLSHIALTYGSAVEAIMRLNGLKSARRLRLGAELVVPVPRSGSSRALAAQARRHGFRAVPADQEVPAAPRVRRSPAAGVVRADREDGRTRVIYAVAEGDSLWSIARDFDVTVEKLRAWNGLERRRSLLRIGQELTIYPGSRAAPDLLVPRGPGA